MEKGPVMGFDVSIRIAGEAGQGIQTIGALLCRIARKSGWEFLANQDYMSRVRGGNNSYTVIIGDRPVASMHERIDLLIALDAESIGLHQGALKPLGRIILDKERISPEKNDPLFVDVAFRKIALGRGDARFAGTVALGALSGMLGIGLEIAHSAVQEEFASKGAAVFEANSACLREGHDIGRGKPYDWGGVPSGPRSVENHLRR